MATVLACSAPAERDAGPAERSATECWRMVADAEDAIAALRAVDPGQTVCLTGGDLGDVELDLLRSGRPGAPIILSGIDTEVSGVDIDADHVVVEGLAIVGPGRLDLEGTGLTARDNVVREGRGQIRCQRCVDVIIERNVVTGADGEGILVFGDDVTVRDNTVSESIALTGDADGIRFFGTRIRITGNTIRDISDDESPTGRNPHTDCFQTFDNDKRTTFDVVISGNTCTNVDHQCLIATGDERGNAGVPSGVSSIVFIDNVCEVGGSQAVLLRNYPHVEIQDNVLSAAQHGVMVSGGSTDVQIVGNTLTGGAQMYYIDDASRDGFHEELNQE